MCRYPDNAKNQRLMPWVQAAAGIIYSNDRSTAGSRVPIALLFLEVFRSSCLVFQ